MRKQRGVNKMSPTIGAGGGGFDQTIPRVMVDANLEDLQSTWITTLFHITCAQTIIRFAQST